MIQVNIKLPKDCNTCPFVVHYHSGGARGFYCSLSNIQEHRWGEANDDGFKFADCPISAVEYKMSVLDKIKAEIEQMPSELTNDGRRMIRRGSVFRIIDKYRTEMEEKK